MKSFLDRAFSTFSNEGYPSLSLPNSLYGTVIIGVNIVLLVLCNQEKGPTFLRSVLSVLYENQNRAASNILIHDYSDKSKWGAFKYKNSEERPDKEKIWYKLLTQSDKHINDLIHWWRQISLNFQF